MTIVCALHQNGAAWVGSDQQALLYQKRKVLIGPKWAVAGRWAVASTGDIRTMNLVHAHAEEILGGAFCAAMFPDRLRPILADAGYPMGTPWGAEKVGPPNFDGSFLVAGPEGVWDFDASFGMFGPPPGRLVARGSGDEYAVGAAHALAGKSAEVIVRAAVQAAIDNDSGCGGEPWVVRLGEPVDGRIVQIADRERTWWVG